VLRPLPSLAAEPGHAFELTGRVKSDSLLALGNQEAVGLHVVAGAGYPQCYTAPETFWIGLT